MFTLNNWYKVITSVIEIKVPCNCNIGSIPAGMFAYNLPFKNNSQRYIHKYTVIYHQIPCIRL